MIKPESLTDNLNIIYRILPFFWPKQSLKIQLLIALSIMLAFIAIVIDLIVPILFKNIILSFSETGIQQYYIMFMIIGYGFLWALVRVADKFKEIALFRPLCRLITDFSLAAFKHIHLLDLQFHLERETGKVIGAIGRSQFALAMVVTNFFFRIFPTIFGTLCAFIILWYLYALSYGLILLLVLFIDLLFTFFATRYLIRYQNLSDELNLEEDARVLDSLFNVETVKFFNRQKDEVKNAKQLFISTRRGDFYLILVQSCIEIIHSCIIGAGLIIANYKVGKEAIQGSLNVYDFILINGYMLVFLSQLHLMSFWFRYVIMRLAQVKPVEQLFQKAIHFMENPCAFPLKISNSNIKFENVNFSYNPGVPVLKNLCFEILGNSTTAVVGSTGSGKSTISRLVFRHYDVTAGRICIDEYDIRDVTIKSLRHAIGIVPQNVVLFNDTLRYNLSYGNFNATNEEILDVLRQVNLDKFVHELPHGLMTQVGENGLKLSGGERQRIAIARTLLKKPDIWIFDEATSSLDSDTEKTVQKSIEMVSKGRTTLIIAHRLSTVVRADRILVLHDGKIAEMGTHEELLLQRGIYSAMWNLQSRELRSE